MHKLLIFVFSIQGAAIAAPKSVWDSFKKGESLSFEEAAQLEDRLVKKSGDHELRVQLLAYYATQPKGLALADVKAARAKHVLWMIEHDPKKRLGLAGNALALDRLNCAGDPLADAEAFDRASVLWRNQVNQHPKDAEIRAAAAEAIRYCLPEEAEKLLIQDGNSMGLGSLYAEAVLGVTGESYQRSDATGADAGFRQRPFAKRALQVLEESNDAKLVESAARALLMSGATLWADGKLDWDYLVPGLPLFERARALAPDSMFLLTMPVVRPNRGERPARIIRMGGNALAKNLVRKVTPEYPADAKQLGVQGTVRIRTLLGLDGKVKHLSVQSGPPELVESALEAVRQWEYRPTLLNGKPVYVLTQIDITFTLSR